MARFICNFISYSLRQTVDITVIIPSPTYLEIIGKGRKPKGNIRHMPDKKYPVLYLLHGIGGNHMTWTNYSNVQLFAEERKIAVVMISGENKSYVDHPGGDNYAQFIQNELPDFVCGMFPVSARPEDTYIAGLSMGGYGALINGLLAPERYAAIGAFSAALHIDPMSKVAGTASPNRLAQHDPYALISAIKGSNQKAPLIYLSCGENDFLFEENEHFRDHLKESNVEFTWSQSPSCGHEWRFWNSEIERFLDWIPREDGYAMGDPLDN